MTHDTSTSSGAARMVTRQVRTGADEWRTAAARAKREGRGIADVVDAFVSAYAAGEVEAPPAVDRPGRFAHPTNPNRTAPKDAR